MKIVMLGCGGFIGSHLLDRLLPTGNYEIYGWDPCYRKIEKHLAHPSFSLTKNTTTSEKHFGLLKEQIAESDMVINLAAICNPAEYNTRPLAVIQSNLFDVYPIVEVCAEQKKWLMSFSTSEVYGRTLASYMPDNTYSDSSLYELAEDETPLIMGPVRNQRWTYACAKQMVERLIFAHHDENGLPFTIIRPLNFFGPRMDYIPGRDGDGIPRVLACFMTALMDNTPLKLVDGGKAMRTILSIHEAVEAMELMLQKPDKAQNQIFNLGNRNNEVTMEGLAKLMRKVYADITSDPSYLDHAIEVIDSESFYGKGYEDCDRRMPDISKAQTLLGWNPKRGLDEILHETMKYYYDEYVGEPAPLAAAA
ncbi:MAG: NAD-dependent epimerase/dehydratase family protein [Cyanobacteria bacterium J06642_12]